LGRLARIECRVEHLHEAVEHIAHGLDLPGHAQIGNAEFADRGIHILEEEFDQRLGVRTGCGLILKAVQIECEMERNHVEASGHRILDAQVGVEPDLPGLRHNGTIGLKDCVRGDGWLAEQIESHGPKAPPQVVWRGACACQRMHFLAKQAALQREPASYSRGNVKVKSMPQRHTAPLFVSVAAASLLALTLAACSMGSGLALSTAKVQGYAISQDALAQI